LSLTPLWQPRAEKDLARLDGKLQRRVVEAVRALAETERGDVVRLIGVEPPEFRLRVGDLRVRFRIDRATAALVVLRVLPRDRAYRRG